MSTNLNDLDPDSPEYEAAVEAALRAEDEEHGAPPAQAEGEGDEPEQEAAADGEAATETTAEASPQGATYADPTPDKSAKPAGVLSKDGKTVLPYGALRGARQEAKAEREARQEAERRAADLERQIADLKAGKKPTDADGEELSDEYLERITVDFPDLAPLVKHVKAARVPEPKGAPAAKTDDEPDGGAEEYLQEAIDSVPLLADWQGTKGAEWRAAIALDAAIKDSPRWKDRPLHERFAHVAKTVAGEFGIEQEEDPPADTRTSKEPTPGRTKTTPEKAIEQAPRKGPNTLSDFKGGAPDPSRESMDRMPAVRQVSRFGDMTDDEIDAHLARLG